MRFHPNVNRVYIINDTSQTGNALRNKFIKVSPKFKDILEFTFLESFEISDLVDKVQYLPENSIVLIMAFSRDVKGKYFSYKEIIPLIADHCNVPHCDKMHQKAKICWKMQIPRKRPSSSAFASPNQPPRHASSRTGPRSKKASRSATPTFLPAPSAPEASSRARAAPPHGQRAR